MFGTWYRRQRQRRVHLFEGQHFRPSAEILETRVLPASSLWLMGVTPLGDAKHPFDKLELRFSKETQDGTFTLQDVSVTDLQATSLVPRALTRIAADTYDLDLTGSTSLSIYKLVIGPNITDIDGQLMDQNRNAIPGESTDAYQATLSATATTIAASDTTTFDGKALVIYGTSAAVQGFHTFRDVQLFAGANVAVEAPGVLVDGLSLAGASTFSVAGAATLQATGTIAVTGDSTLVARGANKSGQVNGQWAGVGVTLEAANVIVEAGSQISADAQGYTSPTGADGNGPGGGWGNSTVTAGGAYGGAGGDSFGPGGKPYGSADFPVDLGSAGGGTVSGGQGGAGGGAIRLEVSGTLTLNGTIGANGGTGFNWNPGGGAGGSIWATVGTLAGTGSFTANGGAGQGAYGMGGGGGGRIAVYYHDAAGFSGFTTTTVNGGAGDHSGSAGTAAFFDTSIPHDHLFVYETFVIPQDAVRQYGALTLNNGATLTVGGGSILTIDGALAIGGNSTLVAQSKNNKQLLSGQWLGEGVTITAASAIIDAGSQITANAQGYTSPSSANGNGPGGGTGNTTVSAGGGYGGVGGSGWNGVLPGGKSYGSVDFPVELGSAGGGTVDGGRGGAGGGAIRLQVSGDLTLNGTISANGGTGFNWNPGGGAGGSIWINSGTLNGAGTIAANGGNGLGAYGVGGGGGGRVAIYNWRALTLPADHVTVAGGNGDHPGTAGTVIISSTPLYTWLPSSHQVFHATEQLEWAALAVDPHTVRADLQVSGPSGAIAIADSLPATGKYQWDTTKVVDGQYELRLTFRNASGLVVATAIQQVLVNNSAVWHTGQITSDETWSSDRIHIVDGTATVAAGVRLTIQPGAVIKFAAGHRSHLAIEAGGVVDAPATEAAPIVFTSLADDSVGGDTNLDAERTTPQPGDWNGFYAASGATLNLSDFVKLRYMFQTHAGILSGNETWLGTFVHEIPGELVVPAGVTLSIQPGAVVKFGAGAGITVQPGGSLVAESNVAQQITFTSIRDDSVGGDTNQDGSATAPTAGDWRSLYWVGPASGSLRYVDVRYGGDASNAYGAGGMIETANGATLTVANSRFHDSLKDGFLVGGPTTIINSLISTTGRGITAYGGGGIVTVTNCTVDNNLIGLLVHGGALTVANTLVTNSGTAGIQMDSGTLSSVRYTDVWAPAGIRSVNYNNTADLTGQYGNRSVDPIYRNAAQGDYRLNYLSPVIDAGDGAVAPATDFMGDPRYNDPRTPTNTGVADSNGHYPDLGAYEFVEGAQSTLDLIVTSVVGPVSALAGETAMVQWTVSNIGTGTVIGPWHDSVYLVRNPGPNAVEMFAGEVVDGKGITLGPGQSATFAALVRVPGDVVGTHYWGVRTNSKGDVFEGQNTQNNTLVGLGSVALDVTALTVGGAAAAGGFAGVGEPHWFQFTPQAGQDVLLKLNLADTAGATELYIGHGYVPDRQHFDFRQTEWNSAHVSAVAPGTAADPYYVTVHATALSGPSSNFSLEATALSFGLGSVRPTSVGNTGPVTLELRGGLLDANSTYDIIAPDGAVLQAITVSVLNSSDVLATFDTTGLSPGTYDVRVASQSATSTLAQALTITSTGGAKFWAEIIGRDVIRVGRETQFVISYGNAGNMDTVGAVILVDGVPANGTLTPGPQFAPNAPPPGVAGAAFATFVNATGTITSAPLCIGSLRPGETGTATFTVTVPDTTPFSLTLWTIAQPSNIPPRAAPSAASMAAPQALAAPMAARDSAPINGIYPEDYNALKAAWTILQARVPEDNIVKKIFVGACGASSQDLLPHLWNATQDPNSALFGWRVILIAQMGSVGFGHVAPLLVSPDNHFYMADTYVGVQIMPMNGFHVLDGDGNATSAYWIMNLNASNALSSLAIVNGVVGVTGGGLFNQRWTIADEYVNMHPPYNPYTSLSVWFGNGNLGSTPPGGNGGGPGPASGSNRANCTPPQPPRPKSPKPAGSTDPNELTGNTGAGPQRFIAAGDQLTYTIFFENLPTAQAAAQEVTITDALPANLDWSTLQLGAIHFNDVTLAHKGDPQSFAALAHVGSDPNPVKVAAQFNADTGVLTWRMESIDPLTNQLVQDPLAGFLPPDDAAGHGVGFVTFTIMPNSGLPTGTTIANQATIVFDVNRPIATNVFINTIDADPPSSTVVPLPQFTQDPNLQLQIASSDGAGSGIGRYDLYVSDNGSPFVRTRSSFGAQVSFHGQSGHVYGFYTVATDETGNGQAIPTAAQATITVDGLAPTSSVAALPALTQNSSLTIRWSGSDGLNGSGVVTYDVYVSNNGAVFTPFIIGTTQTSAVFTGQHGHTYGFYSIATDALGNRQATPPVAQAITQISIATLQSSSRTQLTAAPNPSTVGQIVTFEATVIPAATASATPSGTVTFKDGPTSLGTAILVNGVARLTVATLTTGSHAVTAIYSGDANFDLSRSAALTQAIQPIAGPMMVTGSPPSSGPLIQVSDPVTQQPLWSAMAYDPNFTGGVSTAAGDLLGDGHTYIVTGPGPGGGPDIHVYDAGTGALVRQFWAFDPGFTGGVTVAVGDVNGDGCADIVVAAGAGGGPEIAIYDGESNTVLLRFHAYDLGFSGGLSVALGDVDGDGTLEIITGAGPGGGPDVKALRGTDGSVLYSFFAFAPAFTGGVTVAAADVNNDGCADIIIGAGFGGGPNVRVVSGKDGASELANFFAYDPAFRGGVIVAAADLNHDGQADLISGAGPGGGPDVAAFDGATLSMLDRFFAYEPQSTSGVRVAAGGVSSTGQTLIRTGRGTASASGDSFSALSLASLDSFFSFDAATERFVPGLAA